MKTLFTLLTYLSNILFNNFFFTLIYKYFTFIFKVITIYLKTFLQLYKSLNPIVASCMFLVYVLNAAKYFNSNLNFLGFHKYPNYIPTFASISFWNGHCNIQWHKVSRSQFYSFIIDLIEHFIVYSLSILFCIYIFFNLLVYFTNSNLFAFIVTLQFTTILFIIFSVFWLYIIIFCRKFLFDIGLTTWIKINLLNYKLKYFNLKPFAPNNKYIWNLRFLAHNIWINQTFHYQNLPFRILIATSHNSFSLMEEVETINHFTRQLPTDDKGNLIKLNKHWTTDLQYGFVSKMLILPFTLFSSWTPNFTSDNHEINLPFIPVNSDGAYMIVPGHYYLLPTHFKNSEKFYPSSTMAKTVNTLFKNLININMKPLMQRINAFSWILNNSNFLIIKLVNFTPVIFFAGLIILMIIVFVNIFAFVAGYFINWTSIYTSGISGSFHYMFSQSINTDCISILMPEIMAVYCGVCIGFVANNILFPQDKMSYKIIRNLIIILFLLINVGKYFCFDYTDNIYNLFLSTPLAIVKLPCNCKKCSCGEGDCDCIFPDQCKDAYCTAEHPKWLNYDPNDYPNDYCDYEPDSDLDSEPSDYKWGYNKLDFEYQRQVFDLMNTVESDFRYYKFTDLHRDLELISMEQELAERNRRTKANFNSNFNYKLSFNLLLIIIWLFTKDLNFVIEFTENFILVNDFIEIIFETFLPTLIVNQKWVNRWAKHYDPALSLEENRAKDILSAAKTRAEYEKAAELNRKAEAENKRLRALNEAKEWNRFDSAIITPQKLRKNEVFLAKEKNEFNPKELFVVAEHETPDNILLIQAPKEEVKDIKIYTPLSKTFKTFNGLKIPGLLIHFNLLSQNYLDVFNNALELDIESVKQIHLKIQSDLTLVGSMLKPGYINEVDVTNTEKYPLIGDLIKLLFKEGKDISNCNSSERLEAMNYAYNLLLLNHYSMSQTILNVVRAKGLNLQEVDESFTELQVMNKHLLSKLDNSIKRHFQKTGITVSNNIYAGFDTEYKNINSKLNKLLSVQVSVLGNFNIKVPSLQTVYEFGQLDIDSNKFYTHEPKGKTLNYDLIKTLIQDAVNFNKHNSFSYYISYINKLLVKMINSNLSYKVKDGFYHFRMPMTKIISKFYRVDEYKLEQLINNIITIDIQDPNKEELANNLKDLLSVDNEVEQLAINFQNRDLTVTDNQLVIDDFDNILNEEADVETNFKYNFINTKNKTGPKLEQIYLGVRNNIYLAGHFNAADLPMFSDFEKVYKNKLDIVNKSFATLKAPIAHNYMGNDKMKWNIRIHDTMLLAPPGQQKLSDLGNIYKFPKLELTKAEYEDMELLWIDNPKKFKDYGIVDSTITVIHLCTMTDYYFTLGGLVPPLTLAQISGKAFENFWAAIGYKGYQISQQYYLTNTYKGITPKGLVVLGDVGEKLPMYIQTYKGGEKLILYVRYWF